MRVLKSAQFMGIVFLMSMVVLHSCSDDMEFDPTKPNIVTTSLPYSTLSQYNFFTGTMADLQPTEGVLPYDLNTPLFSDYAFKSRFVYMPDGTTADYREEQILDFPVGAFLIKTFYYPLDLNQPEGEKRILETRLLYNTTDGWESASYIWNDAQTEANFTLVGKQLDVSWTHYDGSTRSTNYLIPNKNDCKGCHDISNTLLPIGPAPRNINKMYDYTDGTMNQLDKWAAMGYLSNAPAASSAPAVPNWEDPTDGTLDERARAYLDINCGHCHNPDGPADNSGLNLYAFETNPASYGVCKPSVAAGSGSGGRLYGIVPGKPDESIMIFRMESTDPEIAMPELARSVIHTEGVELIKEWIASLEGDCD